MTISSTTNRNDYTGNDTTATYNYSYRIFLESDLRVTVRNTTTDVETELALTTDYTVTGVTDASGGTIVLVDAGQAWISASSFLDTGYVLTVRRVVGLTQETDIRNQGDFFPEVHEDFFDKSTMIDQQQQEDLDRAIKLPETITSGSFDTTIPADFVGTESLALVSNATGDGFATGPTVSAIEGAAAEAAAAAASAAAAATSETNAATSETNAATSASNASTSEANAATSETNAAASAAAASTSETNAASSASAASTSATNAATSETNAASSASAAATSASNASTSETNAAASASAASTSETNAATSATQAANAAASAPWNDVSYKANADSPVTIVDGDTGTFFNCDCSAGNIVINLAQISTLTLSNPWQIGVKKTDSSANVVTINRAGTDTIEGETSVEISQQSSGFVLIPDTDQAPDEWTKISFGEVSSAGAGDADTIHLIEADSLADATEIDLQGQNADFDGGGTITASSLSISVTAADLISGDRVIKYDPNANGQNDYFGFTKAIPRGLRGRFLGFSFEYKNDSAGADNDFRFCVKQKDGASAGDIEYFDMAAVYNSDGNSNKFSVASYVDTDCTEIEFGWQNTVTTTTVELYVDKILVSSNPFTVQDVVKEQAYEVYEGAGTGSTNFGVRRFANVRTDEGSGLFTAVDSATDGLEITFLQACYVDVTYQDVETGGGGSNYGLGLNSSDLTSGWSNIPYASRLGGAAVTGGVTAGHVVHGGTSWSGYVQAGDVIRPHGANADDSSTFGITRFSIKARVSSPHIITPARSNLSEWTEFTSVFQGSTTNPTKGTIDYDEFHWRRVGDSMELHGSYRQTTAGTAGSGTYLLQIPEGLTVDTSKIYIASGSDNGVVGSCQFGANEYYGLALVYSTTQLSFSGGSSTQAEAPWSSTTPSGAFSQANLRFSFHARVPILEWANSSTEFLAAIPEDLGVKPAIYYAGAASSIVNGVWTKVGFNTVVTDQDNLVPTPVTNWKYICPKDGVYEINSAALMLTVGINAGETTGLRAVVNGVDNYDLDLVRHQGSFNSNYLVSGSVKVALSKDDEIIIEAFQDSGAAVNTNASKSNTYVSITREQTPVSFGGDIRQEKEKLESISSGSFTGGDLHITRVGNQVCINVESALTFASSSTPASAAGLIPQWARPTNFKGNATYLDGSSLIFMQVYPDGTVALDIRNWSGAANSLTSSTTNPTISYNVD